MGVTMSFGQWTFLSNHTHVLMCVARNPTIRSKQIASLVGITERQVYKIISDLEDSGVIFRRKVGRRNHYVLVTDVQLRHPIEENKTVGDLLRGLLSSEESRNLGL